MQNSLIQGSPEWKALRKKGMLEIKEFSHKDGNGNSYWKALCDCGNFRTISTGEFNRNRTPTLSCGCYRPFEDLTGKTFSSLTVMSLDHRKNSKSFWICRCKCGNSKIIAGESLKRKSSKSCGCLVKEKAVDLRKDNKGRIMSSIKKNENGCWIWKGLKDKDGYGKTSAFSFPDQRAHRSSYILFVQPIPEGLCVLHKCDTPSCVNPDHLYVGTVKQNCKDALERGQFPKGPNKLKGQPGEKNCKSKLDTDKVKYIRFLCDKGFNKKQISQYFNVHRSQIQRIARRSAWTHI